MSESLLRIVVAKPGLDGHDRGADAVGLLVLSGAHMTFAKVAGLLEEGDAKDIVVFGGSIPEAGIPELEKLGVAKVFTPARRRHSAESGSAPTSPPTDCAAPKS